MALPRSGDFQIADLFNGGFKPPLLEKFLLPEGEKVRMRVLFGGRVANFTLKTTSRRTRIAHGVSYFSRTIINTPSVQSKPPMIPLSYFSRKRRLSFSRLLRVSQVKTTIPKTVAIERTAVSSAKPIQP